MLSDALVNQFPGLHKKRSTCQSLPHTFILTAKFEEKEEKVAKLCNYHSQSTITSANKEDYLQMELLLLQFFDWNIILPCAAHFLEYFIAEAAAKCEKSARNDYRDSYSEYSNIYMHKYTNYFLEISLQGIPLGLQMAEKDVDFLLGVEIEQPVVC